MPTMSITGSLLFCSFLREEKNNQTKNTIKKKQGLQDNEFSVDRCVEVFGTNSMKLGVFQLFLLPSFSRNKYTGHSKSTCCSETAPQYLLLP